MDFDPADEQRWAAMSEEDRLAEHERLRNNYLSQLEARVCQLDSARRQVESLDADIRRIRDLVEEHNGRLPQETRRDAESARQILDSDSERVREHRARVERAN